MNDFGIKISKDGNAYVAKFWFLDSNRIVCEETKKFFIKSFAMKWSKKKIYDKIASQYIKEN